MDITNYLLSGHSMLFIETAEIKRAINNIKADNFNIIYWNYMKGIYEIATDNEGNKVPFFNSQSEMDPLKIIDHAMNLQRTAVVLENFDEFIDGQSIVQELLDANFFLKANQTCLVMVGVDSSAIPTALKEFIPVIEFKLPSKEEIKKLLEERQHTLNEQLELSLNNNELIQEEYDKFNYEINDKIIEACQGLSYEEIDNVISYTAIVDKCFKVDTILRRKKQTVKSTGFMNFMPVLPIETLGGLDLFKKYAYSRKEPFENPDSIKPKIKGILLVGYQGAGKSHAVKCLCSLLGWPGIVLDVNSLKGKYVGDTKSNTKLATKIIDGFGKCIVMIDEIEKIFGSGSGGGFKQDSTEDILEHFLNWMQERESDAIIVATSNNLDILPPELKRAGRWDAIFFVNLPNPKEIKEIIDIKNKQFKSNIPNDDEFCNRLHKEHWSGAEIEQLAKDIHYENDIETAMAQIPRLAEYEGEKLLELKKKAQIYRNANAGMPLDPKKLKRQFTLKK